MLKVIWDNLFGRDDDQDQAGCVTEFATGYFKESVAYSAYLAECANEVNAPSFEEYLSQKGGNTSAQDLHREAA